VVYDFQTKSVVEGITNRKKQSAALIPNIIDISSDDAYSIESNSQAVWLRSIKSKLLIAKYEGHLYPVSHMSFVASGTSHAFLTASDSECLLWNPREQIKSGPPQVPHEVSQPDKLLDLASSDPVTGLALNEQSGSDSTFMAAVSTDSAVSIFYLKSTGVTGSKGQQLPIKSKTIKRECIMRVNGQSDQVIQASITGESSVGVVHGSVYQMRRANVRLLDEEGKVQREIMINKQ
jgi:hypothetical protein